MSLIQKPATAKKRPRMLIALIAIFVLAAALLLLRDRGYSGTTVAIKDLKANHTSYSGKMVAVRASKVTVFQEPMNEKSSDYERLCTETQLPGPGCLGLWWSRVSDGGDEIEAVTKEKPGEGSVLTGIFTVECAFVHKAVPRESCNITGEHCVCPLGSDRTMETDLDMKIERI